jgi:hypothetical protein
VELLTELIYDTKTELPNVFYFFYQQSYSQKKKGSQTPLSQLKINKTTHSEL